MGALGCSLSGCANDGPIRGVDKPTPPSLEATLAVYETPTAVLTVESLALTFASAAARSAAIDGLGVEQAVFQAVAAGLSEVEARSASAALTVTNHTDSKRHESPPPTQTPAVAAQAQALTVQGNGYLYVERICDGWGPVPVPSGENGQMELTIGFTETGVDPVVWGTLRSCRYRLGERQVLLEGTSPDPSFGDVRVFIGRNVQIASFGAFLDPVLVELSARAFIDGNEVAGYFSYRIDLSSRAAETAVQVANGYVIVGFNPERGAHVLVRAANGVFTCDIEQRRCVGEAGEELVVP
jgi:hypothetical protein